MPEISLPYQLRQQITDLLSLKPGFIWLHKKLSPAEHYDLLAWQPQWTITDCKPEDVILMFQQWPPLATCTVNASGFFDGGLAGYIGYNFSRQQKFHKPRHVNVNNNREAAEQKPIGEALPPDIFIGYYPTNYLVINHCKTTISGDVANPAELAPALTSKLNEKPATTGDFQLTSKFVPQWTSGKYRKAYQQIKEYIAAGDCYQVNLTQRLAATYQGDPFTIFKQIIRHHETPHFAYIKTGRGDILSFSPESFLSINNQRIRTKPIKGTRRRHSDPAADRDIAEDLLSSNKDRAENVMIVDLLRNDIGRIAKNGTVRVEQLCQLESFSNVHHLVSLVCADLKDSVSPLQALLTCSPGGSITGAPKIRAMEVIDELEDFSRNAYCGSIFFCDHNNRLESNIAIRTLTCRDGHVSIWGGGGIVADSSAQQEYEESLVKIQHLITILEATIPV